MENSAAFYDQDHQPAAGADALDQRCRQRELFTSGCHRCGWHNVATRSALRRSGRKGCSPKIGRRAMRRKPLAMRSALRMTA